jgi:hypothetical protein
VFSNFRPLVNRAFASTRVALFAVEEWKSVRANWRSMDQRLFTWMRSKERMPVMASKFQRA